MDKRELKECVAMAGETIAWLDEKTWTDEDKASVAAGCLPVFISRLAKDKETFDKIKKFFLSYLDSQCEAIWKQQRCTHDWKETSPEMLSCAKCNLLFPR